MPSSELRLDVTALDRASQVFADMGRTVEKLEKRLQELDRAKAEPEVSVKTDKAERQVGQFAKTLKKQLEAAVKSLPDVELSADASDAQREIATVRKELAELASKDIGVDLDAGAALLQAEALQRRLAELNRDGVEIDVRADASAASGQLEALQRQVAKLNGEDATVKVEADTAEADREVGNFASRMQSSISSAIRSLPDIEIAADSSDADLEIAAIKADLRELSSQRIGIDVDATLAQARVDDLARRLHEISGQTGSVQLDADTAAASAKLGYVEEQLDRVDGRTVSSRVDVDTSAALAGLTRLGQVMGGIALGGGILAAIPQLASLASAAVAAAGALGTIPAAVGAGGAAFGALKIGLSGVSDAFTEMGKSDDASAGKAASNASAREAAANRIRSAQEALAQAQQQADRQAIQSAQQVAAAQQGVADAVEAARRQAVSSARQVAAAQAAVAEAQRRADERAVDGARQVAQARQAVADAVDNAARRQEQAEASLERAQVSARDAQLDLNRARADAKERIEDLSLALSGAALSEESAQIRLARAQERLAKLGTGASGLDRQEAALAVREAEQALKEARERYGDIKAEAADANAKGVEGADNVTAAQRRVADANQSVLDGERNLNEARTAGARAVAEAQERLKVTQEQVARSQADSARSIAAAEDRLRLAREDQARSAQDSAKAVARAQDNLARAQQQAAWAQQDAADRVAKAQRDVAEAMKASATSAAAASGSIDRYSKALSKLSPNARAFVQTIKDLKPRWDELTRSVQNNLFAGVAEQTRALADIYLPKLSGLFGGIATSANRAALDIAGFFTQDSTAASMQTAFDRIGESIDIAADAALPLVEVLTTVFTIGTEFLKPMAEDFKSLAERMAEFTRSAEGQNKIRAWIQGGIDTLKQFGELFWNVGGIIAEVFRVADSSGVDFLGTLVELTGNVKEFLRSPEGNDLLTTVFDSVKQTVDNLKPGFMAIWDGLKAAIAEIAPKIPGVADSFSRLAEKLAPILSDIAVGVFNAMAFAFDVLSRLPAPVLVALAGALVAVVGLVKVGGAIKSTVELFDALGKAKDHVSTIADKLRDIFGRTNGKKGALKEALLGADGCTSTRACLDEVGDKLARNNDELDKTSKKSGSKTGKGSKLGGLGKVAGSLAGGVPGAILGSAYVVGQSESSTSDTVGGGPLGDIVSGASNAFRKLPALFTGLVDGIISGGDFQKLKDEWNGVTSFFTTNWDQAVGSLSSTSWGSTLLTNLQGQWSLITGGFESWTTDLGGKWNGLWGSEGSIATTLSGFGTWVGEKFQAVVDSVKASAFYQFFAVEVPAWWDGLWGPEGAAATTLGGVSTWVGERFQSVVDTVKASSFYQFFATEIPEWWTGLWGPEGSIATTLGMVKDWVGAKFTEIKNSAVTKVTEWKDSTVARVSELKTGIETFIQGIPGWVRDRFNELKDWAVAKATEWKDSAVAKAGELKAGIENFVQGIPAWVRDRFTEIKDWAIAKAEEWKTGAQTKAREVSDVITTAIRDLPTKVQEVFGRVKDWAIAKLNELRDQAKTPIDFVVNTVYTQGLKPMWNGIARVFSLPQLATGGIMPGYTPGRDVHIAALSGGEAVMRPEWTRAAGEKYITGANRAARLGGVSGAAGFITKHGLPGYALGGIVDDAWNSVSGWATNLFTQGAGSIRSLFDAAIADNNRTPGAESWWKNGAKKPAPTVVDEAVKAAQKWMTEAGGYGKALAWAKGQVGQPYVWAAAGPNGYDCSGFMSAITNVIRGKSPHSRVGATASFPWSGFSPGASSPFVIGSSPNYRGTGTGHMAGTLLGTGVESRSGNGVVVGGSARTANDSGFTVRAGMTADTGGILKPGQAAFNNGLRPERVLSPDQTASFERLVSVLDRSRGRASSSSVLAGDPIVAELRALGAALREQRGITYAPTINNPRAETSAETKASDARTAAFLGSRL